MEFSQILEIFDIKEMLKVENYILGQNGYIFSLNIGVAYLYEETKGNYYAEIYVNGKKRVLTQNELKKIKTLIRLQRVKPRKLNSKDFWIYSKHIEDEVKKLLERRPDLERGNTHMAFAPKNYTRFSENLLFDFSYFHNDREIIEIIRNFDNIYNETNQLPQTSDYSVDFSSTVQSPIETETSFPWSDDQLYRYLLDYIRSNRISINGKISLPQFLRLIYSESSKYEERNIYFNFGPFLLCLSSEYKIEKIMPRKQNIDIKSLEEKFVIIRPDTKMIGDIFDISLE